MVTIHSTLSSTTYTSVTATLTATGRNDRGPCRRVMSDDQPIQHLTDERGRSGWFLQARDPRVPDPCPITRLVTLRIDQRDSQADSATGQHPARRRPRSACWRRWGAGIGRCVGAPRSCGVSSNHVVVIQLPLLG